MGRAVSEIILAALLISTLALPFSVQPVNSDSGPSITQTKGPRMNSLAIRYFSDDTAAYNALKNGTVDLTNLALSDARRDEVFNDTNIRAAISSSNVIFEFDFNNNATTPSYRSWTNPTAYKGFRQGIAFLVNKTHIVEDLSQYAYRIDTPIARPTGEWWVDPSVSQYDTYGALTGNYPYEFNSSAAAYYFDQSGFTQTNTTNPYFDESFSASAPYLRRHPATGTVMQPLIFYIRNDDPKRLEAGRQLRDYLRKMGIPVNATEASASTCRDVVLGQGDYHIYTGGWSSSIPDSLEIYTSGEITPGFMINYVQFRNSTYDDLVRETLYPSDLSLAREAAQQAQKILVQEAVSVWLWSPSWISGYRNLFGIVNSRGELTDNQWTFLNARSTSNRTEIQYGLYNSPETLNIVTDYDSTSVLNSVGRIYDTLLSYNPYDNTPGAVYGEGNRGGTMPWMAEDWEVGRWESPYNPSENLTKLTFYLRDGIRWHDGVTLNSSDVEFTVQYLKQVSYGYTLPSYVFDVHHVTTPDARTVIVYENVSNVRTLDYIGMLPILPKHIFENIANVTGYTPGADVGYLANETLIGTGPWEYSFYNSSMLYLEANRDYFLETQPLGEVDFRYNWERGSWVVDALDATMVSEAFFTQGFGVPDTKWEPGADMGGWDGRVDISDIGYVAQGFNKTWGASAHRRIEAAPTPTALYIEHSANPIVVGQNVTVYVKLRNAVKLSGFEFKLSYDNAKLDFRSVTLTQVFGGSSFEWKKVVNETLGEVWASVTMLQTGNEFSGNTTLATMVFTATQPSGSILGLWETELASLGAPGLTSQPIVHLNFDRSVMVGVLTPSGTNVEVAPAPFMNVTFAQTTSSGVTTLNVTQPPSTEFVSVVAIDVDTNATYTGSITLQFAYDPTGMSLEDEQAVRIWLWNETTGEWLDVTTSVDTAKNIVYGVTPHLSVFGVTSDVTVEGETSTEGQVTTTTPSSPPLPPPGLMALKYYDIRSTAVFTGPITIRLAYDERAVPPGAEAFVKMWAREGSVWVDVTTEVDTVNNVIYGVTSHLSVFGVTSLPPSPPGIAVSNVMFSKTVIGQGYSMTMNFVVENVGDFAIDNLGVIVYGNSSVIGTRLVSHLDWGGQVALSLTWSTAGWEMGNYTVSIGSFPKGWAVVTIPGDVDATFSVTILDVVKITGIYASKLGEPEFKPNSDIDGDGVVTILDVVICTGHYGDTYP